MTILLLSLGVLLFVLGASTLGYLGMRLVERVLGREEGTGQNGQ